MGLKGEKIKSIFAAVASFSPKYGIIQSILPPELCFGAQNTLHEERNFFFRKSHLRQKFLSQCFNRQKIVVFCQNKSPDPQLSLRVWLAGDGEKEERKRWGSK